MTFIIGFAVWLGIGLVGAFLIRAVYAGPDTTAILAAALGISGAVIGGMLGTSAHVFHDPTPLRVGGLTGAVLGAFFFSFVYNLAARKAV